MWLTATAFISALQCIVYEYGVAQQTSMSSNTALSVHPWAIQPRPNLFKCWGVSSVMSLVIGVTTNDTFA